MEKGLKENCVELIKKTDALMNDMTKLPGFSMKELAGIDNETLIFLRDSMKLMKEFEEFAIKCAEKMDKLDKIDVVEKKLDSVYAKLDEMVTKPDKKPAKANAIKNYIE